MQAHVDFAVRFVIASLFGGLWQAPLFAVLAWLVLRVQPRANATTRHSIFAAALVASLFVPILTAGMTMPHALSTVRETSNAQTPKHLQPYIPPKRGASVPTRTDTDFGTRPGTLLAVPTVPRLNFQLPKAVAIAIVAVWSAGAALVLFRLIVSLLHLERLKRDALPLPVEYRASLTRWAAATKGSRNVRLCRSDEIEVPIAVGLFDAMILVPNRLLDELEPHDIDSIVLHELAHLRRSDDWINALERFGHALLFFNPAIAWIAGQIDLEREVACDDWVLQQNDALPYATCLAKVVESTIWPYRAMTAPGAFVTRRGMSIRIERLLAKHRDVRVHTSIGPAGGAVAVIAVFGLLAAFVSPSIAYSVAPTPPQPPRPAIAANPAAPPAPAVPVLRRVAHIATPHRPHVSTVASHPLTIPRVRPAAVPKPFVVAQAAPVTSEPTEPPAPKIPKAPVAPERPRALVIAEATKPDYIEELASAGYKNLPVDELVELKNLGVSAELIRGLEREGLAHPSVSELIQIRALRIDPKYIGGMRRRFGGSLSVEDIAGMKALGVTSEYADDLADAGLKGLSADQVRGFRAVGLTPAYVRNLARAGYANLAADQLQQLKALNIDGDFVSRASEHGFHNLTIEQLIQLRTTGVL